jgi:hypothetical protein
MNSNNKRTRKKGKSTCIKRKRRKERIIEKKGKGSKMGIE